MITNQINQISERLKVVTDEDSLRHEFRVSTGEIRENRLKIRHYVILHAFYVII